RAVVGGGNREPGAREISRAVRAAPYLDRAAPRQVRQRRYGLRTHQGDVGTRRDQAAHLLLRHGTAADHDGAPAAQVEEHRVERGHCNLAYRLAPPLRTAERGMGGEDPHPVAEVSEPFPPEPLVAIALEQ